MAAPKRRSANAITWNSPENRACSLAPIEDSGGFLEIDVVEGAVSIHGRHCHYHAAARDELEAVERNLAELDITVALSQCQIDWKVVDREEAGDIERSAYFREG